MAAQKPKLYYFAGRGRAELVRYVLAEAAVDYDDVRLDDIKSLKENGSLPFGQVPMCQVDGVNLAQTNAIARYFAAQKGLMGSSPIEAAIIDSVVLAVDDVRSGFYASHRGVPEAEQKAAKEKWGKEKLPGWLAHFENLLKANKGGQGFIIGSKVSLADIIVLYLYDFLNDYPEATKNAPLLSGLVKRVAALPRIAAWIAKRPQTQW